jgi:UDP-2,4-diacetamido-2,4,6-trideoxy-beta-L-altropyranose hydrolase
MTKKLIFRADGNAATGLGHLYRLFALVEMCKIDYEFIFISKETSTLNIIPSSYKTKLIPGLITIDQEPDWLVSLYDPSEYIIVADGYQFSSTYQKNIKEKGFKLIYIDDLAQEHMYADVVVNHSPYAHESHFSKEPYTKLALGTKYALLRPLFLDEAKQNKSIQFIDSAFICFGGVDSLNLTKKAVEAVLKSPNFKQIHVVLGGAYAHEEIFNLEEKQSDKITIYRNLPEDQLISVMKKCNFSIAPASTILYELLCVKMPVLSGFYVENQKNIYKGLVEEKVIIEGGDFSNYTVLDFEEKINPILQRKDIDLFLSNQHELFNGNSKPQFLGLLNQINISFRKAKPKDVTIVFNWSNDELVRINSYNSNRIEFEDHKNWFSNKITNKNTLFLIALINNNPAGMVRFDIKREYSVVGILISKSYRGQKLASEFLTESSKAYFKKHKVPILAYIKKENKTSVKVFEKSGYTYLKDEIIHGIVSFVYKLEKKSC